MIYPYPRPLALSCPLSIIPSPYLLPFPLPLSLIPITSPYHVTLSLFLIAIASNFPFPLSLSPPLIPFLHPFPPLSSLPSSLSFPLIPIVYPYALNLSLSSVPISVLILSLVRITNSVASVFRICRIIKWFCNTNPGQISAEPWQHNVCSTHSKYIPVVKWGLSAISKHFCKDSGRQGECDLRI